MPVPGDTATAAYLTYAPRPRMFREPWQRYAWAAVPLLSLTAFTFLPFLVAWRRGIMRTPVVGAYLLGSAVMWTVAVIKPDRNLWITAFAWTLIITATVHILLLDPIKRQAK
ncbi:hypothetical protein [Streptomyces sp. NPDC086182]|uniref:hypothetical protein n=1 Tax=Streptomyces sp. NPDC086182 TaxID=3155058 RepID=UPI003414C9EE